MAMTTPAAPLCSGVLAYSLACFGALLPTTAMAVDDEISIAVTDVSGDHALSVDFSATLLSAIAEEIDTLGPFRAITADEVRAVLAQEIERQRAGCDTVGCWAELGGALGAQYMVMTRLNKVDDVYLVQMQVLETQTVRTEARVAREYRGGPLGLVELMGEALRELMANLLERHAGWLRVTVSEENATIMVDDRIVGVSPLPEPLKLPAGPHLVEVEREGFVHFRREIRIEKDDSHLVSVLLQPSAEFVLAYRGRAALWRTIGWISGGMGAAAVITSGILIGVASAEADSLGPRMTAYNASASRDPELYSELHAAERRIGLLDTVAMVSGAVGVVGLGVGLSFVLAGDDPSRYDDSDLRVSTPGDATSTITLTIVPGGISLGGSF